MVLYYCSLSNAKPIAFAILVSWLAVLFSTIGIAASDFFCINLSTIASILGMSESMAGVTFLAFGNGSPDVFSTFAAMNTNSGSLAVGELIGAAGFITAVVAGSMALVRPFKVAKKSFVRDVGFFVVAASFSMVFLYDGKLRIWECIAMVLFYVFYVVTVVLWHWWLGRSRRKREREAAARGHFNLNLPGNEEYEAQEEYHDEEDYDEETTRPTMSRGPSTEDFSVLERGGGTPQIGAPDEYEEEEARDKWMGELSSNMRLNRPAPGRRRNTMTPIRPSLVGALEFQAVLNSLQKSRNIQTIPLHARRYSDDPTFTSAQQQDAMSSVSDPTSRPPYEATTHEGRSDPHLHRPSLDVRGGPSNRTRAVSANDAATLRIDPRFLSKNGALTAKLVDIDENDNGTLKPPQAASSVRSMPLGRSSSSRTLRSPTLQLAPHSTELAAPAATPNQAGAQPSDLLAQPSGDAQQRQQDQDLLRPDYTERYTDSPAFTPPARPQQLPKIMVPAGSNKSPRQSAPTSPFPAFSDSQTPGSTRPPSLYLPPASVSVDSHPFTPHEEQGPVQKPLKWWPYRVLPPPRILISTLLPTLYNWRSKNWWERILGLVSAPSVLLLTITLPVVENENEGDEDRQDMSTDLPIPAVPGDLNDAARKSSVASFLAETPSLHPHLSRNSSSLFPGQGIVGHGSTAGVAIHTEQSHNHLKIPDDTEQPLVTPTSPTLPLVQPSSSPSLPSSPKSWNRWLTITQLFVAPLFTVVIVYTQYIPPETGWFDIPIKAILISLLCSTVLLIPLLSTTTPSHRPAAYKTILSMAGFVVSIAWISTIAGQVVALLKALAIILNMSHAILGLTVFAVGNSLGDLVADITVARLGYPVMALSACFGGPLLNILLGIGLSGSWILIRGAEHRHRNKKGELRFVHIFPSYFF